MIARRPALLATAVAVALAGCGGHSARVSLAARAPSGLLDAPATVAVRGLAPHARVTLHARWSAYAGHVWTSSLPLRADGAGTIRLAGLDGMRFLWGMRPVEPPFRVSFFEPAPTGPSRAALSVVADGRTVARAGLSRRLTPAGARMRGLSKARAGVEGLLFIPDGRPRGPAVLVFGGSEGGDSMYDVAGLLAAHGYPALSLAYFGEHGLPRELVRIPLEYFARAARVLRRVPGVDPRRIAVMGTSRGGEAALLIAATFPHLIHGAIGLVPSATVFPAPAANLRAWTLHGKAIPLEPIPVERIDGPVLTAGAGDDHVWPSAPAVHTIEHRLTARHFRFPHQGLVYAHAGHLLGTAAPYLPTSTQESGDGGTPRADAAARADLWRHILRFLAGPLARR